MWECVCVFFVVVFFQSCCSLDLLLNYLSFWMILGFEIARVISVIYGDKLVIHVCRFESPCTRLPHLAAFSSMQRASERAKCLHLNQLCVLMPSVSNCCPF